MNNQTDIPKSKYNVVIIGSGFSGIVAADILAEYGLSVLLTDENLHIGGQLLRKIPENLGEYDSYHPDYVKKIGFRFIKSVKEKKITIMNRTCLMAVYPDNRIMLETERKTILDVSYETLLFSTGARERYLPFKGWTLPGVYSTGMMQVLMKSSGVLPARNIVIGGSGLFLFSAAYEFLKNKGKVHAVLELSGMMDKVQMIPALVHQPSKAVEGARYLSKIYLSGVPVKYRHKIIEARGNRSVEEIVTAKVDANGKAIAGTEKIYKTDAAAIGCGFIPNIEAPQLAGCDLEFADAKGGWIVKTNDKLETSVPNVLAAGEITGVGGALKSINEGRLAANTILEKFEKISPADAQRQQKHLTTERKHHMQFVHYFNSLYAIPQEAVMDIPDDTIICRCEDITIGDMKKYIAAGYRTPKALKTATRVTMGNCQGRTCGPLVYDLLRFMTHQSPEQTGLFASRPPLKPLSIHALADCLKN